MSEIKVNTAYLARINMFGVFVNFLGNIIAEAQGVNLSILWYYAVLYIFNGVLFGFTQCNKLIARHRVAVIGFSSMALVFMTGDLQTSTTLFKVSSVSAGFIVKFIGLLIQALCLVCVIFFIGSEKVVLGELFKLPSFSKSPDVAPSKA